MEYIADLKCYIEGILLMTVEVEFIEMITNGIIPKMSPEERTHLNQDVMGINVAREKQSECALDLSKKLEDHFLKTLSLQPCLK